MEEIRNQAQEAPNARAQAFLSLQNLEKVYPNGEKAVYNFNLDIRKNEFIVIVGPSGCGKSTTLRMLAGLEDISEGDIFMEGELINYKPCKDRRMAIVFQSYALYPQMSVYDNIAFPLTINKYPMPAINATLAADSEIRRILGKVPFVKFVGVLYNVFAEHSKNKGEEIANIFGISEQAGKLLAASFAPYKRDTLESLHGKEGEIRAHIDGQLSAVCEAERAEISKKGIVLDENFCELDENGKPRIEMRKYTPYEIRTRVYETADKLDLSPYLDKLPKELSGGQMQRVALGRAIIKNVPVFLMDEPLSNLDAKLRLTMRSEIVKLHNRINATTVYVTHDQIEAMTKATRIVVMSRGFVQQIGTPEEVYSDPANIFVARFIGSPSMNIFEAEFDRGAGTIRFGDVSVKADEKFVQKHDAFYAEMIAQFESMLANFDQKAEENLLKILSATRDNKKSASSHTRKKSLMQMLRAVFAKKQPTEEYAEEKQICSEMLDALRAYLNGDHTLTLGIRPERVQIEKYDPKKTYKNCFISKPTVCELLGGEYNIHFDFCNRDMVGTFDANEKISTEDQIAVSFSTDSIYIFDPVTGGRIV